MFIFVKKQYIMDKTLIALTIFYFIPVVLSFILSYLDKYTETIEDLMEHFWVWIVPGLNIIFIVFVIIIHIFESDKWVKFKNIKINRMKEQANFLIKHYEYFNKEGKVANEYYYIQEWKKFLWWSYWKDIKHTECGLVFCYKTRAEFETLEEAQKFIREVLCPEIPRDNSREKVVDEMVCKNGESKW